MEDLSAIYKYVPKTKEGRKMILQEYEPGEHNQEGYKLGWLCDVCKFNSHDNPSDVMSMFRWCVCVQHSCVHDHDTHLRRAPRTR